MDFYGKQILKTMSIVAMLGASGGCAQDTMIRVNSTSALTLVPATEIRYKACGDSSSGCQAVFDNIASEKAQIVARARAQYQEYLTRKQAAVRQQRINEALQPMYRISNCSSNNGIFGRSCQVTYYPRNNISTVSEDRTEAEPNFNPTAEDTKKIIKEVSSSNLNEYTFSKADGSIVVICPTKYCAIGSGDGGWIGIGESGKSIDATSVVRAQS